MVDGGKDRSQSARGGYSLTRMQREGEKAAVELNVCVCVFLCARVRACARASALVCVCMCVCVCADSAGSEVCQGRLQCLLHSLELVHRNRGCMGTLVRTPRNGVLFRINSLFLSRPAVEKAVTGRTLIGGGL